MKKIAFFVFLIAAPLFSQTAAVNNYCVLGATQSATSGLKSSNYLQGVIPSCTVTVYLTGTITLATIYSDSALTALTNPFTASTVGAWLFYAAVNQGYDVVLSGGVSPNVYQSPVTLVGLYPAQQFTNVGNISGSGTLGKIPIFTSATTIGNSLLDYGVTTSGTFTVSAPLTSTGTVTAPNFVGSLTGNATTATYATSAGTASNITGTTNSTLTTLSALSLPYSQVSGTPAASTWESITGGAQTGSGTLQVDTFPGSVVVDASLSAKNMASIGPRFDVTQFGAVGNGTIDDTAAIQAAFNACWANGTGVQPYGGVVEFPGNHTYLISSTINAYDSCRVEGVTSAGTSGANAPTEILWGGATYGATASLTSFAVSLNVASITLTGNPNPGDTVTVNGVVVTFVASGAVGNQVNIGASAAATATALWTFLQTFTTSGSGPIYNSYPFTNPSAGVVDFKYQSIGLNGLVESVATSDPANITVQAAYYTPANPSGGRNYPYQYVATIQATNSYAVGNWVYMTGFSTQAGTTLNNLVSQVAAASGSSFVIGFPESHSPSVGSYTDTGTSTSISVDLATDSYARYQQGFDNIQIIKGGIAFYMGSRIDTGSHFYNTWAEKQSYFGYYIAAGGINPNWDHGWRAGSPGVAGIYWRGSGYFAVANGQTDSSLTTGAGAGIMLDNQGCNGNNDVVRLTLSNVGFEANPSFSVGLGAITLYDCAYSSFSTQFQIGMNGVNVTGDSGVIGYYTPSIVMSPANDSVLNLSVFNSSLQSSSTNPRWIGIPSLIRQDASLNTSVSGNNGFIPVLSYSPSFKSMTGLGTNFKAGIAPSQCLGDCAIGQLWQYGIQASAFLYSDTAYAALPNATTLYAGQVLAPPAYWNGANGKRYVLDVVYQSGTTGTPNSGATTCSAPGATAVATCTSATDLSVGQFITLNGASHPISNINSTNSTAVLITSAVGNFSAVTNGALTFTAPVLGLEMQFPTKSSAAPTTLAWLQGDMEQNSGAAANGICGWVNVAAGTPGTWTAIPCGNSSGQLLSTQITGTFSTSQIGTGTSAAGMYVDGGTGAWTTLPFKSLTTTGTSGAATLVAGVLNIPQYSSSTGFTSGSNSNGYWTQDPTGHIHQWGHLSGETASCNLITFPTAFTTLASIVPGMADDFATGASIQHSAVINASHGCTAISVTQMYDWVSSTNGNGVWWSADGY